MWSEREFASEAAYKLECILTAFQWQCLNVSTTSVEVVEIKALNAVEP